MVHWHIYDSRIPDFVKRIASTAAMQRLRDVGMNCGCEYTSFPLFKDLEPYSRYDHSVGAALIVWHFTRDVRQTVAALLHDIATPAFAHVIDFLHNDHIRQESTEDLTAQIIGGSQDIQNILGELDLTTGDVADYHIFPVADNPTPQLSADRLEYTCGNVINYGVASEDAVRMWYNDLVVGKNGRGEDELMFRSEECAMAFGMAALRMSEVYTAPEDRYAMQRLAELLKDAITRGLLTEQDLYRTESDVVGLLCHDREASAAWKRFRAYSAMTDAAGSSDARTVPAKKRYINPYVENRGRLSDLSEIFRTAMDEYLQTSFSEPICAV